MGEMPEQKSGVFMAEPEVSAPAAMVAAIADLVSSLAWPAVVASVVLYVARNPAAREYASNLTRSEEHTSELQSLMRISYAVSCLKIKQLCSGCYCVYCYLCRKEHCTS